LFKIFKVAALCVATILAANGSAVSDDSIVRFPETARWSYAAEKTGDREFYHLEHVLIGKVD
jgi:hypothetical protein